MCIFISCGFLLAHRPQMCGYADTEPCPPCIYLRLPLLTMDGTHQSGGIKALKEIQSLMTDPLSDTWVYPDCNYENEHYIRCIMCNMLRPGAILPSKFSTLGCPSAVVVNKNHPATATACVCGPGHPSKGTSQSVKHPPTPACESPHRDAKEKAIASMKPKSPPSACVCQMLCNCLFFPLMVN
jgi:hypothetical protein